MENQNKKRSEREKRKRKELIYVLERVFKQQKGNIKKILLNDYSNRKWLKTGELLKLLQVPIERITQMRKFGFIIGHLQSGAYYYSVESISKLIEEYLLTKQINYDL